MARSGRRRKVAHLDSAIVKDDEALGAALGDLLRCDPGYCRSRREIIRRQTALQHIVSAAAWRTYLDMEEVQVARLSDALDLAVRWAFAAGLRSGRRRTR